MKQLTAYHAKNNLLKCCLKAAGIYEIIDKVPMFVRKTDEDVSFELSAAFGDELESNEDYNLVDEAHYNLYYYRIVNGTEEKLVARIKREGIRSHFYFVSQDDSVGDQQVYFATVTHYKRKSRFEISNLN